MRWRAKPLICFWFRYVVFESSAWENVGTTMLIKGLTPKMCMLCFVLINSVILNLLCV